MFFEFKNVSSASTERACLSFSKIVTSMKYQFKEWVRREIIDFDPYDDEGEFIDFPEELRTDK